jgi:fatty acid-binding protein DegV
MPRICILTDSTACFTKSIFAGQEHVSILPHSILVNDHYLPDSDDLSIYKSSTQKLHPPLIFPPTVDAFRSAYISLGMRYKEILVILLSSHLSMAAANAQSANQTCKTPANIYIIDSMNTAIGLGLLVQAAAEYIHRGHTGLEINRLIRGMVNHI